MGLTPLTFTGLSTFSNDYQTILNRATQIAQLPVTMLQNQDVDVLQKKTLLGNLNSAVGALVTSLSSLGTTAANRALSTTSSNPAAVTVANTGAAAPATYTINSVTSAAAAASERTIASFATSAATPVSATGTMKLVVGSESYPFDLATNSLTGLRDKINSLGAGVTASVITASGTSNYLSITTNATGATTLQHFDDPDGANNNVHTAANQGANAVFQLNGININQPGNVVNSVLPGVTFTIAGSSDTPVTLTLATDRAKLSKALGDFVASYNALAAQLSAQQGKNAGLLSGDNIIGQLNTAMRQLTSYRLNSGSIRGLADLGIQFSQTGEASLDQTAFDKLSDAGLADALTFAGSTTNGLGGFSKTFDQFSNSLTGAIQSEQLSLTRTDQRLQQQITALNDRVAATQKSLAAKLQQADALVARLQAQQNLLNTILSVQTAALTGTLNGLGTGNK